MEVEEYLIKHFDVLKEDILKTRHSIPNRLEKEEYTKEFITILKLKIAQGLNISYGDIDITDDSLTRLLGREWKND